MTAKAPCPEPGCICDANDHHEVYHIFPGGICKFTDAEIERVEKEKAVEKAGRDWWRKLAIFVSTLPDPPDEPA